ncbi:MAG TPA: site-2 protease family protein [Desulfotomaculum sp.]|nr:MAG: Peptidase M50 [Desulfotomaculum sp. 46_80]HAG10341.1 site-2 protease family protein [Desulfotomaculum sp.]HBY04130.1 site-2 protease family protein [Desulfotomaculum sp.]
MFNFPTLYDIAILLPAVVIGLTFHEYAHGWAADRLGDRTARYMGRLTLNPVAHIDVVGLIMIFIAGFGWAKPVPVNPLNLVGDMRRSLMLVSLAGPATNLLIAVLGAVLLGLGGWKIPYGNEIFNKIILLNLVLAIFNLIPVPPLDGSKILAGLLPGRQEWLSAIENYGTLILILLLFTGVVGFIIRPIIIPLYNLLIVLAQGLSQVIS